MAGIWIDHEFREFTSALAPSIYAGKSIRVREGLSQLQDR